MNYLMDGGDRRDEYRDFTNRYDEGAPYDGAPMTKRGIATGK
jgi:hypothetical protein